MHLSSEPTKSPSSDKSADEELLSLPTDDGKVEMLQIRTEELEKAVTELEENYNMSTGNGMGSTASIRQVRQHPWRDKKRPQ